MLLITSRETQVVINRLYHPLHRVICWVECHLRLNPSSAISYRFKWSPHLSWHKHHRRAEMTSRCSQCWMACTIQSVERGHQAHPYHLCHSPTVRLPWEIRETKIVSTETVDTKIKTKRAALLDLGLPDQAPMNKAVRINKKLQWISWI